MSAGHKARVVTRRSFGFATPTFPIQSRRFYHALKGHGATARLVMLPHESHGYRPRESVMHMAWELTAWLDKYVKDAKPPEKPAQAPQPWE